MMDPPTEKQKVQPTAKQMGQLMVPHSEQTRENC
jgi:hypothetical protein